MRWSRRRQETAQEFHLFVLRGNAFLRNPHLRELFEQVDEWLALDWPEDRAGRMRRGRTGALLPVLEVHQPRPRGRPRRLDTGA